MLEFVELKNRGNLASCRKMDVLKAPYARRAPFASWERGYNVIFNGLLRQYVPKKSHMANTMD